MTCIPMAPFNHPKIAEMFPISWECFYFIWSISTSHGRLSWDHKA